MSGCATVTDLGVVRDVLGAVECNTRSFAQLGYQSLTASSSPFQTALTLALTIYVALLGYRLLFGEGARLSDGPVIALKIGAVLTLVTSWSLFQTLVFDMAQKAPLEIAAVISAPLGGAAANPVSGLQRAYDALSQAANTFAHPSGTGKLQADYATASQALTLAANALFLSGAGLVAVITIAIGFLTATGPLFIALFLFVETRGFFVGWLRALAACAFGLISAWSLSILMLHAIAPWIGALSDSGTSSLSAHTGIATAIIVMVFSAAQLVLFVAALMIARGFAIRRVAQAPSAIAPAQPRPSQADQPLHMISRPARLAEQLSREDGPSVSPGRVALAVASVAHVRRDRDMPLSPPQRIGDFYRRPAAPAARRSK